MLGSSDFVPTLPAADIERAKAWYRDKLGIEPYDENPAAVMYRTGSTEWQIYPTSFAGKAEHTLGGWYVEDLDSVVAGLRERGVVFEEYDLPGLKTEGGIATLPGERAAWFKDSESNIVGVFERTE